MADQYPKWVVPHPNIVVKQGAVVSTALFPAVATRTGTVLVLVNDAAGEAAAMRDPGSPAVAPVHFPYFFP